MSLDALQLTGRSRSHIVDVAVPACSVHRDVVEPLQAMRAAAAKDGIKLVPVSSFRDFERQRAIWNAKFRGERSILDRDAQPIDALSLEADARVAAIMYWSAIPGASRHHWGTDLDVIDRAVMPLGAPVSLVPAEFSSTGPFAVLDAWLTTNMHHFGFFRPYSTRRSGVSPEPWHISYAPLAQQCCRALTTEVLSSAICSAEVDGCEILLQQIAELHARYIVDVDEPPSISNSASTGV